MLQLLAYQPKLLSHAFQMFTSLTPIKTAEPSRHCTAASTEESYTYIAQQHLMDHVSYSMVLTLNVFKYKRQGHSALLRLWAQKPTNISLFVLPARTDGRRDGADCSAVVLT